MHWALIDPVTTQWEEGFERLQAYVKEYKHCRVPRQYTTPDGYHLGGWVGEQRVNRDIRFPERKARLDALGFDWDPHRMAWEKGFEHLQAYAREYENCRVPHQYKSPDGYSLGGWVLKQRQKRDTLPAEREARLDALGFDWDPHRMAWEEGFEHFQAYASEFKNCRVPIQYQSPDGYRLGKWVSVQRLSRDGLSSDRKNRLDELGFDWDPLDTGWEIGFEHLEAYVKEFRHCRVPVEYKTPDGYRLGQWASFQRVSQDRLPDKGKAQLNTLGFVWRPLDEAWEQGVRSLTTYKEREGHCLVPADHKEGSHPLGRWVVRQRRVKDKITSTRIGKTWIRLERLPRSVSQKFSLTADHDAGKCGVVEGEHGAHTGPQNALLPGSPAVADLRAVPQMPVSKVVAPASGCRIRLAPP
jgi:Helicase associated domain